MTRSVTGDPGTLAHVAGAVGIVGQLVAAIPFVLLPALVVPPPATYLFVAAWVILLVAALAWWRRHPWRSALIPILSVPAVYLVLALGERSLGWAP